MHDVAIGIQRFTLMLLLVHVENLVVRQGEGGERRGVLVLTSRGGVRGRGRGRGGDDEHTIAIVASWPHVAGRGRGRACTSPVHLQFAPLKLGQHGSPLQSGRHFACAFPDAMGE